MNSKEIFEKINQRNKYVVICGNARNSNYSEFRKASTQYDNSKKGFYTAIELTRIDRNIAEDKLRRYEHLVKHYDKQLLQQLKDREFHVKKIPLENDKNKEVDANEEENNMDEGLNNNDEEKINNKEEDALMNRISKIETEGYLRNRFYFEFVDNKQDYEKAKILYYKETSLALQDGLISEIEKGIHIKSMKNIEAEFDDHLGSGRRCSGRRCSGRGRTRGEGGRGRGKVGGSRCRYGLVQRGHPNGRKLYIKNAPH